MFEALKNIFKKGRIKELTNSKDAAKERLHLVLMQDRANVSADFLDLMRAEIVEVIKKYIDIDEKAMDVRLTTETNEDGTQGGPALYANIPIINIKDETRKLSKVNQDEKIISQPPKNVKTDENSDTSSSDKNKTTNDNNNNNDDSKKSSGNVENRRDSKNVKEKKNGKEVKKEKEEEHEDKTIDVVVSNAKEIINQNSIAENNEQPDINASNIENNKEDSGKKDSTEISKENKTNNSNENKEDIKEKKNEE